jgi:beta-ureidopropionase / N-carbamoyl-L-amino-acid hydrolase
VIRGQALGDRLAGLDAVGVGPAGVNRLAWTAEDAAARDWFERQAIASERSVRRDPAGNLWACPSSEAPWWAVGSHLDSVRDGGRFDGPLGVVCGFEIASGSALPLAVIAFADEEGARFNTPTFGSKALAGRLDLPAVLERADQDGVRLGDAMRQAGVNPEALPEAPPWLGRLSGFFEIHIDQSTELAELDVPVGVVSGLASRQRLQVELRGRADHAGTTPRGQRRDALAAAARLIIAAEEIADGAGEVRVTTSRMLVAPNAPTTIAANVRLWIDSRASTIAALEGWTQGFRRFAAQLQERSGVEIAAELASRTPGGEFSPALRRALAAAAEAELGHPVPEVLCYAGHDAGVVGERIPAAMLLVRNRAGVSHAPEEAVELEDAAIAANVVARALGALAADGSATTGAP